MTLNSLIHALLFDNVSAALIAAYPDITENNLVGYRRVWESLYRLDPIPSTARIVISWVDPDPRWSEPDDEGYWDVSGKDPSFLPDENVDGEMLIALEFTPWAHWLGMEIDSETLAKLSPANIIAHCLWEMTFCGFTEKERDEEWKEIEGSLEDALSRPMEEIIDHQY